MSGRAVRFSAKYVLKWENRDHPSVNSGNTIQKECQISGKIRIEMGKLRPSVRKFREYERKGCQIFGKIRTEVEKLRPSVRISREAENGFEIFLHPESQT